MVVSLQSDSRDTSWWTEWSGEEVFDRGKYHQYLRAGRLGPVTAGEVRQRHVSGLVDCGTATICCRDDVTRELHWSPVGLYVTDQSSSGAWGPG